MQVNCWILSNKMNYRVLFFSVNRHQEQYFKKIIKAVRNKDQGILLHKRALLWRLPSLSFGKSEFLLSKEVNRMRLTYSHNKTGKKNNIVDTLIWTPIHIITTALFLLKVKNLLREQRPDLIILWNDMKWHQYVIKKLAIDLGIKTSFFENGTLPNTVTFDRKGVNFNNSIPRDKKFYLDRSKENSDIDKEHSLVTLDKGYIFIPFQVDYDTQIISHSPWVKNMEELYFIAERLLASLPEKVKIIIKEHPKSARSYEYLHSRNPRIVFENTKETDVLVLDSKIVITLNSTVGLESVLKDKPVLVLGNAFYAIEGLCQSVKNEEELAYKVLNASAPYKIIKNSFIEYLKEYYVEGNWHQPSSQHINNIEKRIYEYLERS